MLKSYRVECAVGHVVVAHKILLSAPVPWIGDLGLGDWGLGLDNMDFFPVIFSTFYKNEFSRGL